jgi:hypothetical protein
MKFVFSENLVAYKTREPCINCNGAFPSRTFTQSDDSKVSVKEKVERYKEFDTSVTIL